jgi:hypothetical protein
VLSLVAQRMMCPLHRPQPNPLHAPVCTYTFNICTYLNLNTSLTQPVVHTDAWTSAAVTTATFVGTFVQHAATTAGVGTSSHPYGTSGDLGNTFS